MSTDLTLLGDTSAEWYSADPAGVIPSFAPRKIDHEGYLYILEFDSGTVKVGKATEPRSRLQSHASHAHAMGRLVVKAWVSRPHKNFAATEQALIKACASASTRTIRKEYFEGLGLTTALQIARSLTYARWSEDDERHAKERAVATAGRSRGFVDDDEMIVSRKYVEAAERWLRFVRTAPRPNGTARPLAPLIEDGPLPVAEGSEMYSLLATIAERKGLDIEDVADWSYVDVLGDLLATEAFIVKQDWILFAHKNNRPDLLESWVDLTGDAS